MSDLHLICTLKERPITDENSLQPLIALLKLGVPSTYTVEEALNFENGIEDEPTSTTTPLHLICENIPVQLGDGEEKVVLQMAEELFLRGAGWSLLNDKDETPGCVLQRRNLVGSKLWDVIVDAGVRLEMLLRKMDDIVEFLSDDEVPPEFAEGEIPELVSDEQVPDDLEEVQTQDQAVEATKVAEKPESADAESESDTNGARTKDASNDQNIYLLSKLEYKNDTLVTEAQDGVMMAWENNLMEQGCKSLFKNTAPDSEVNILNIGFGMGIIDTMIQSHKPTKHYICEAHPDVLSKMEKDGWFEKENVIVLTGRWQDTLPELLSKGIFFDGIYYDTFSEHYEDMLDLFDLVVGLLKSEGVFSFFNGLGADRFVVYEVYKRLVELDLNNYGLQVKFTDLIPNENTLKAKEDSVWKDIRRSYWNCPVYHHPEVEFM